MKLTLEPTPVIENVNGTPCRLWRGQSDKNFPVRAWIAVVELQTNDPESVAAFDKDLKAVKTERALVSFDLRTVV